MTEEDFCLVGQIKEVSLCPRDKQVSERKSLRPNVIKFESYKGRGGFPGFREVSSNIFFERLDFRSDPINDF